MKEMIESIGKKYGIAGFQLDAISRMTKRNYHTEAHREVAKIFGYKVFEELFDCVIKIQKIEGHLPSSISEYEYGIYKRLMLAIEQDYGKEEMDRVSSVL